MERARKMEGKGWSERQVDEQIERKESRNAGREGGNVLHYFRHF